MASSHKGGAMLPVWGAYIMSSIAIGLWVFAMYIEPVAAKLNRETAKDTLKAAILNHDAKEIEREVAKMQGAHLDRLGIKVRPSYE